MEELIADVPELRLRKSVGKRTIHRNDKERYPDHREGDVIELVAYYDPNNTRWSEADLKYYIFLRDTIETESQPEPVQEKELELA